MLNYAARTAEEPVSPLSADPRRTTQAFGINLTQEYCWRPTVSTRKASTSAVNNPGVLRRDLLKTVPQAALFAATFGSLSHLGLAQAPREGTPLDLDLRFNQMWGERVFSTGIDPPAGDGQLSILHEDLPGTMRAGHCAACSADGEQSRIRVGPKTYQHGIGVTAQSTVRVSLARPAVRFLADIGLDRSVDNTVGSVRFRVTVGEKEVFVSDIMRPSGIRQIDLALNGALEFDLTVDTAGDGGDFDIADWADARVVLQDGSQVWLDDLASQWRVGNDLPISFVLGGRRSSELLPHWKRAVERKEIDASRRGFTVTLSDPQTGLELRAEAIVYTDVPGVDWTLHITNRGTGDSPVLEHLKALNVTISPGLGRAPVLHRLHGSTAMVDDWLPFEEDILPGKPTEFSPRDGKSSQGACPFFNVAWPGGGVITAIGWSGQWVASVEREKQGSLHLQAGQQNLRLTLHPGETVRSPRILQLYWFGEDPQVAYNLFRRTMLHHVVPKVNGTTVVPPIVHLSTSFYESNGSTEKNVLSHLESIKGLGFEVFWLDAYWTRDGFPEGMGHYGFPLQRAEPPDRFPLGLRPIADAAHQEQMGFLAWFEPERVAAGTEVAIEHPDWIISDGNNSSSLFNLGVPAAREFMTKYLIAAIRAYGMDWLRIDFNISPGPFWQVLNRQNPDRVGIAEIRYVEGLYRMWDDILRAYPKLSIDNCASGGMRIDLETCSRSLPLWRTDGTITPLMGQDFNQAALQNQVMTAGLSRFVPFSTSGEMGATPYWFRSGFNAGISFCEDCRPAGYPRALLKQAIAEGKRIRKYYFGNFYPLNEVTSSPEDWCVLQYHRREHADGMVLGFRRHRSPYSSFRCALHEIDPVAQYRVTTHRGYEGDRPVVMKGAALREFQAAIEDRPGSLLIEYRKV
jgi:alpha-galactosidase